MMAKKDEDTVFSIVLSYLIWAFCYCVYVHYVVTWIAPYIPEEILLVAAANILILLIIPLCIAMGVHKLWLRIK